MMVKWRESLESKQASLNAVAAQHCKLAGLSNCSRQQVGLAPLLTCCWCCRDILLHTKNSCK